MPSSTMSPLPTSASAPVAAQVDEAVRAIRALHSAKPRVGVVLGSGLSAFAAEVADATRIPYASIPHFPRPTAEGHKGELVLGQIAGVEVAVMAGRAHYYEGYAEQQVVYPVRVLGRLGIDTLVLTNAAGAVNLSYAPGHFMAITDHLNMTGLNPLRGPNDASLGPRFPEMSAPYDAALRASAVRCFRDALATIHEGVYIGLTGPSYETPAEIRMFRGWGADAVGMSTVLETIAARHMGLRVAGISCITNAAVDLGGELLSHEAVLQESKRAESKFKAALVAFVRSIGATS